MAPREKIDKATTLWSTHDNACAYCREKRIRCGRERPRCANCKRDGVECGYSTPGKRVNHIKLLCNNVAGLEDRLVNIEAELSSMNTLLKRNRNQSLPLETATENECSGVCSSHGSLQEDGPCLRRTDRHIVRRSSNLTDRYHGPCTLVALCHEFYDTLISLQQLQNQISAKNESQQSRRDNRPATNDAAESLLKHICLNAGTEESIDLQADPTPIRLPPKQLLLMAQTHFFQQADYATELFVQSSFRSNVESVYNRPFKSEDEAWAVCFNAMILLTLGLEDAWQAFDSQTGSHFVRPFLLTVCSALSNPRILMVARMINVQALALLSIAAQMYYPLGFAESIFAQACVLARTMGLHQARPVPEGVSSEEAQERFKVFRSLYLRDKSSSITRGSICWLPSIDCSISLELDEYGRPDTHAARTQLARLEDESYRLSYSADSAGRCSPKYKSALLRIEQSLEHWANVNEVFSPPYASTRDVDLTLEFLATRICVLRRSPELNHVRRALDDSRASCLLVVISYGKHEPTMTEQLDTLLLPRSPSKSLGRIHSTSETVPSRFHSLLDNFSVPAFFLLAANLLRPSLGDDESRAEQDLNLLQKTCACFKECGERTRANNHIHKVGQTFEGLLEVVNLIKGSEQLQSPHCGRRQSTNAQNIPSTTDHVGVQHQVSEFCSLPSPLAASIPLLAWETFSTNNASGTTPDSSSAGSSGLLTPMDSYYQSYDPLRQILLFPPMQQQIMQTQSSDRQYAGVSDVFMNDYAGTWLPEQVLARNPAIPFDITQ